MTNTKVIFRKFSEAENGSNEVIALFPLELYNAAAYGNELIMSYQHIGQHGAASYDLIEDLETATEAEYMPLYKELESIGYKLEIIK